MPSIQSLDPAVVDPPVPELRYDTGLGNERLSPNKKDLEFEINLQAHPLFGSKKPPRSVAKTTVIPVDLIHEASTTFAITILPRRHSRRR